MKDICVYMYFRKVAEQRYELINYSVSNRGCDVTSSPVTSHVTRNCNLCAK